MEIDKFTHSWVSTSIQVITWKIIYHADVCRGIIRELDDWPFLLCEFSLTVTYWRPVLDIIISCSPHVLFLLLEESAGLTNQVQELMKKLLLVDTSLSRDEKEKVELNEEEMRA